MADVIFEYGSLIRAGMPEVVRKLRMKHKLGLVCTDLPREVLEDTLQLGSLQLRGYFDQILSSEEIAGEIKVEHIRLLEKRLYVTSPIYVTDKKHGMEVARALMPTIAMGISDIPQGVYRIEKPSELLDIVTKI